MIVAGSGPRSVVTTASYEARKFGVGSAMPAAQARRLCPTAIVIPPDFTAYREKSREVWSSCAPSSRPSRSMGLDEAYARPDGRREAAARRCASLIDEIKSRHRDPALGRHRAEPADRQVSASDPGKPAGLRRPWRASRRASASPTAPPRLLPGIGPEDRRAAGRARLRHRRPARGDADGGAAERFGDRMGRYLLARASLRGRLAGRDRAARCRCPARRRSRPTSPTPPSRSRVLRRLTGELCEGLAKNERRGRTIAIKVRLADFTTVTRARTIPARPTTPRWSPTSPARSSRVRAAAAGAAARRARGGVRGVTAPPGEPTSQMTLAL